jgi:ABC-type transport system involved in multi-copper enzyme maturation permease subunit
MLTNLFIIENHKLYRRIIIWVEIVLFVGLACFAYLMLGVRNPAEPALLFPASINQNRVLEMTTGYRVGGLLFVVLVAASTAPDYGWGTLNLLVSRSAPRPLVLIAKFLALLFPCVLLTLTPQIGSAVVSAGLTLLHEGSLAAAAQVDWGKALLGIALAAYSLLPYGALAFFLAILTRSSVFSIGVAAGFGLIGENMLISFLQMMGEDFLRIAYYLPGGLIRGLFAAYEPADIPGLLSPGVSAIGIALYALVFLILSIVVFQKQDLSA